MGGTDRGPDTHSDPPLPLAVAPLAALPGVPRPVPTSGLLLPALPLPRGVAPPVGPHLRLPPPRRAPWPAAFVLAVPVPLPAPAAARTIRRHRAGTGAVGGGRAPGLRAEAAGSEGAHEDAAAGVHGRRGADDRAQHRDHRGHHARGLLGPAWPLLIHLGSGGTWDLNCFIKHLGHLMHFRACCWLLLSCHHLALVGSITCHS